MQTTTPTAAGPQPTRRGRRLAALVAAALVLALVAGCSTVRVLAGFTETMSDAGFTNPRVEFTGTRSIILVVSAGSPPGSTTAEAHEEAARLVWERFPRRVEQVRITIDGDREDLDRSALQERFGPRDPDLDATALDEEVDRFTTQLLLGMAVGGLLLVAVTGVIVLLVVRNRRTRAPQTRPSAAGGRPGWPGAPPGWPPPGVSGPPAGPPEWPPPHASPPVEPSADPGALGPGASPTGDRGPAAATGPEVEAHESGDPTGSPAPAWTDPPTPVATVRPPRRPMVGRKPRGPVPPPEQTPPGWER